MFFLTIGLVIHNEMVEEKAPNFNEVIFNEQSMELDRYLTEYTRYIYDYYSEIGNLKFIFKVIKLILCKLCECKIAASAMAKKLSAYTPV